jgi:predicted permease
VSDSHYGGCGVSRNRRRRYKFAAALSTGLLVATGALVLIGWLLKDVYESLGGSLFAGTLAFAAGTAAAAIVDERHMRRYAEIVALYLLLLSAGYILILPAIKFYSTTAPTPPPVDGIVR